MPRIPGTPYGTVVVPARRLYRLHGVHRRAELAAKVRAEGAGPGAVLLAAAG